MRKSADAKSVFGESEPITERSVLLSRLLSLRGSSSLVAERGGGHWWCFDTVAGRRHSSSELMVVADEKNLA